MVAGVTSPNTPQAGIQTPAQRNAALTTVAQVQQAKTAMAANALGGAGGGVGPAQPLPNNTGVANTNDLISQLSSAKTVTAAPSAGVGPSTVFNKADTFSAGHEFNPSEAQAEGYTVLQDSNAIGGYVLISGPNVLDINGNYLYSTSPSVGTKTSGGVSYPASIPNTGPVPNTTQSSQAQNPPLDYQQFGTQAAATIKPVNATTGSEQTQVYQVNVDGANYTTSVGFEGDNINARNQAIDQAYNLYLSALNSSQNRAITTGISNTITGADANTGQISLEYNLPQTTAQLAPQAGAQPLPTGYTINGVPLTAAQAAQINTIQGLNLPPAEIQALESGYLGNTLTPAEAIGGANQAAAQSIEEYTLANAVKPQVSPAVTSLANTYAQQTGSQGQNQTGVLPLDIAAVQNLSQRNTPLTLSGTTLSNQQLAQAGKASSNPLTVSYVEQLLNNFGKTVQNYITQGQNLLSEINPLTPTAAQEAQIKNITGSNTPTAAFAGTIAGAAAEIYNLDTRIAPETYTAVLNSGNRLLNGAASTSGATGTENGQLVKAYLQAQGIPNNLPNILIYGLTPASQLVLAWATKTPEGQATLASITAANPSAGQAFTAGLKQQTAFQQVDPTYLQKSITDFASYSNNIGTYINNNHNVVGNFIASVPLGFSQAVQTGNVTTSPLDAVLANIIIAAYLEPELVIGAPLKVVGDSVGAALAAGQITLAEATALKLGAAELANSAFMLGVSNIYAVMTTGSTLNTTQDAETLALALAIPGATEGLGRLYSLLNPTTPELSITYGTLAPETGQGELTYIRPQIVDEAVAAANQRAAGTPRLALPPPMLGEGTPEPPLTIQQAMNPYGSTRGAVSTFAPEYTELGGAGKYEYTSPYSAQEQARILGQAIAPGNPAAAFDTLRYLLQERQPIQLTLGDQVYEIGSPATRTTQAEAFGIPSGNGLPVVKVAGEDAGIGGTAEALEATGQQGSRITKQSVTINNGELIRTTYSTTRFGRETTMVEQFDFQALQPNNDEQNSLNLRVGKDSVKVYNRYLSPEEVTAVVYGQGLDIEPSKTAVLKVNYQTTLATSTPLNKIPINLAAGQTALEPGGPLRLPAAGEYMNVPSGNLPVGYTAPEAAEESALERVGPAKQTVAGTIGTTRVGPEPVTPALQQYNLNIQNNPITPTARGFSEVLSNGETLFYTFQGVDPKTGQPIYSIIMQEAAPNAPTARGAAGTPSAPSYSSAGAPIASLGPGTGGPTSIVNLNPITLGEGGKQYILLPRGAFGEAAFTGERPLFDFGEEQGNLAYSTTGPAPTVSSGGTPIPTTPTPGTAIPTGGGQFQYVVTEPGQATQTGGPILVPQEGQPATTAPPRGAEEAANAAQGIPGISQPGTETITPEGTVVVGPRIGTTKNGRKIIITPPIQGQAFTNPITTPTQPTNTAQTPTQKSAITPPEIIPIRIQGQPVVQGQAVKPVQVQPNQNPTPTQTTIPPPPPPKRTFPPPTILIAQKAQQLKQQKEAQLSGKAFGIYHPEFNIIGGQAPLSTGALLGLGSRPAQVTPQDVQTLNSQGILVKPENMVQPSAAPQTLQTQSGVITVDPLSEEVTNAQAATAGVSSPGALVNTLPPNLRLLLNSLPPEVGQALMENYLANSFTQGVQQQGGINAIPASTETAIQVPGQAQSLAQAQMSGSYGLAQTLPQSPLLQSNPNPAIVSEYQTIQQLLNAGAIDIPTYWSLVQSLLAQSTQPNQLLIQSAEQEQEGVPIRRRQTAEVFA